ncbi:hypothetical protein HKX48_009492 [Thoreauomyces humboldtii]|nr:hypothetical protein HKX48_009492 [Thoreauomyces humboldtii]
MESYSLALTYQRPGPHMHYDQLPPMMSVSYPFASSRSLSSITPSPPPILRQRVAQPHLSHYSHHDQPSQQPQPSRAPAPTPKAAPSAIAHYIKQEPIVVTQPVQDSHANAAKLHRDHLRKVSHSAIERRRRERINDKIVQLKDLVPACANQENLHKLSILQNAIQHIHELKSQLDGRSTLPTSPSPEAAAPSMSPSPSPSPSPSQTPFEHRSQRQHRISPPISYPGIPSSRTHHPSDDDEHAGGAHDLLLLSVGGRRSDPSHPSQSWKSTRRMMSTSPEPAQPYFVPPTSKSKPMSVGNLLC